MKKLFLYILIVIGFNSCYDCPSDVVWYPPDDCSLYLDVEGSLTFYNEDHSDTIIWYQNSYIENTSTFYEESWCNWTEKYNIKYLNYYFDTLDSIDNPDLQLRYGPNGVILVNQINHNSSGIDWDLDSNVNEDEVWGKVFRLSANSLDMPFTYLYISQHYGIVKFVDTLYNKFILDGWIHQ